MSNIIQVRDIQNPDVEARDGGLLSRIPKELRDATVRFQFDSTGGSANGGLVLLDWFETVQKNNNATFVALAKNRVMSAALLPFLACKKRYGTPQSTFLMHPTTLPSSNTAQVLLSVTNANIHILRAAIGELESLAETIKSLDDAYIAAIKQRSSVPNETMNRGLYTSVQFGAEDALAWGLIHEIVEDFPS